MISSRSVLRHSRTVTGFAPCCNPGRLISRAPLSSSASIPAHNFTPRFASSRLFATCTLALACGSAVMLAQNDNEEEHHINYDQQVEQANSNNPLALLTPSHLAQTTKHLAQKPLSDLVRSYLVYLFSESSLLVDIAPIIESSLSKMRDSVPLLGFASYAIFRFVVRYSFFPVFVAGETVEESQGLMTSLLNTGCGSLLNYSVEAEVGKQATDGHYLHDDIIQRTENAIRVAGRFPSGTVDPSLKPTWVAIKLSGMIKDPTVLERATNALLSSSLYQRGLPLPADQLFPSSPELSSEDETALSQLHKSLMSMGMAARESGVRVDIDAEQTWFQPAIDRFYTVLAENINRAAPGVPSQPIIYNTYQTYLVDSTARIAQALQHARTFGHSFGAKLVRGAYMDTERSRAAKNKRDSPIHLSKEDTDRSFDACASYMTAAIADDLSSNKKGEEAKVACMLASHNVESVKRSLSDLLERGLVEVRDGQVVFGDEMRKRIVYGQLLGMADSLTGTLLDVVHQDPTKLPVIVKYLPWGETEKVMPYLIRRAQENKAVLSGGSTPSKEASGAKAERLAVGKEIRKRLHLPGVINLI